jgi:hypothetical protein
MKGLRPFELPRLKNRFTQLCQETAEQASAERAALFCIMYDMELCGDEFPPDFTRELHHFINQLDEISTRYGRAAQLGGLDEIHNELKSGHLIQLMETLCDFRNHCVMSEKGETGEFEPLRGQLVKQVQAACDRVNLPARRKHHLLKEGFGRALTEPGAVRGQTLST